MVNDNCNSVNKLRTSEICMFVLLSLVNDWTSLSDAVESVDPNCFWLPKTYAVDYSLIRICF